MKSIEIVFLNIVKICFQSTKIFIFQKHYLNAPFEDPYEK